MSDYVWQMLFALALGASMFATLVARRYSKLWKEAELRSLKELRLVGIERDEARSQQLKHDPDDE